VAYGGLGLGFSDAVADYQSTYNRTRHREEKRGDFIPRHSASWLEQTAANVHVQPQTTTYILHFDNIYICML